MTPQQIFDTVARHLLTQARQARSHADFGLCAYRASDGCKCAAGALIPDDLYDPEFEGHGADSNFLVKRMPPWWRENLMLIRDLQVVHDSYTPEHWKNQLALTAIGHHLSTDVLQ
jgi:hypothetical protein